MKKLLIGSLAALALITTGCSDHEEFSDAVFFTGSLSSSNIRFNVDGQDEMGVTVTSSAKATNDIEVVLAPAPELVEAYSQKTGRPYVAPPAEAYSLENGTVTIKAGTAQSTAMKLIADADKLQEGVGYCLPLTIKSVKNGPEALEAGKTVYVLFTKVITIKVASLGRRGGFDIQKFWLHLNPESPVQALPQMTLEMKVLPVSFPNSPRSAAGISSLCGCEENFLFRFGDGAGQPCNRLQLAKASIGPAQNPDQKDHFESWLGDWDVGQWVHFAAVYDGSFMRVYIDGQQVFSYETKNGGTINLAQAYEGHNWDDGFSIGRSVGYARYFDGYVSECRVWNVARTVDQIENGICYVDPTSEGLIGYWRFNGEVQDDGTVRDETGHGYDATPFGTVTYVDNQKCPY